MPDLTKDARERCMSCVYGPNCAAHAVNSTTNYCNYLDIEGHSRGCPAGRGCIRYKSRNRTRRQKEITFGAHCNAKNHTPPKSERRRRAQNAWAGPEKLVDIVRSDTASVAQIALICSAGSRQVYSWLRGTAVPNIVNAKILAGRFGGKPEEYRNGN